MLFTTHLFWYFKIHKIIRSCKIIPLSRWAKLLLGFQNLAISRFCLACGVSSSSLSFSFDGVSLASLDGLFSLSVASVAFSWILLSAFDGDFCTFSKNVKDSFTNLIKIIRHYNSDPRKYLFALKYKHTFWGFIFWYAGRGCYFLLLLIVWFVWK